MEGGDEVANPQTENNVENENDNTQEVNNNDQQQQQQPQRGGGAFSWKSILWNIIIIYFVSSYFRKSPTTTTPTTTNPNSKSPSNVQNIAGTNLFVDGEIFDTYIYLSDSSSWSEFAIRNLIWSEIGILYKNDGTLLAKSIELDVENDYSHLYSNGSMFIHTFLLRNSFVNKDPMQIEPKVKSTHFVYKMKELTKHKKLLVNKKVNLITGKPTQENPPDLEDDVILPHWHENLTIYLVHDFNHWPINALPPPLNKYVEFHNNYYYPILYPCDYWNLKRDYQPINSTVRHQTLHLNFGMLSLMKFQFYAALENQNTYMQMFQEKSDEEDDTLKEMMIETDPILLGITVVVSLVHTVFEFLAFKNDIQFWKSRRTLVGLSVRVVFLNLFQSGIVFFYILDNESNFLIIVGTGIGLLIDLWKITKVVRFEVLPQQKILGIFPKITMKELPSYAESPTKEFDKMAFRYLSWFLFPLLTGYGVYSLTYNEHRCWYSFVLSMLYGFLLTFGFIAMTPQLFINYKMKSVAHLPWRMLTYKFLNTFIDDLFAFVIKMPTLYRIGCFRDDIVFIIFIYQRWIYRVDPKRKNEYGLSANDLTEKEKSD